MTLDFHILDIFQMPRNPSSGLPGKRFDKLDRFAIGMILFVLNRLLNRFASGLLCLLVIAPVNQACSFSARQISS